MATLRSHQVFLCLAGENGEKVEDVEKKILIRVCHRMDEPLVRSNDHFLIVGRFGYRISSGARQKKVITRCVPIASRNYRGHAGTKQSLGAPDTKGETHGKI